MSEEKMYTEKEVESLISSMRERMETLEALDCARSIMIETKQYPRFINRIDYIIKTIVGDQSSQDKEMVKDKEEVSKQPQVKSK